MKNLISLLVLFFCCCHCIAQEERSASKKGTEKMVDKAKKINDKTKELGEASNQIADQAKQSSENVKQIVGNVKTLLKIFEPILSFHFKKNKEKQKSNITDQTQQSENQTNTVSTNQEQSQYGNQDQSQSSNASNGNVQTGYPQSIQSEYSNANNMMTYGTPENNTYNQDGTMNLGHQNNGQFGNCLNLLEAKVMGMGEAEDASGKVDLIFFSQYGGLGYSLESPFDAPTINEGVSIKSWRERNETEIAETKLTISQFEKISSNTALMNAVKNTQGFGANFYTSNKMDGRVFAVKLQQDNKEVYALLAVYKQFGTAGSKGYLQIKIKVQGIDKNGDGYPDANAYMRQ